ncbi:MAG TPA: hypothetical protein VE965_00455, partial [Gammaproteobacteria bacterium]|nr:hypothetical protein [Gammaproteobacteria bacterium]
MQHQLHPARFIEEPLHDQRILGGHDTQGGSAAGKIVEDLVSGSRCDPPDFLTEPHLGSFYRASGELS